MTVRQRTQQQEAAMLCPQAQLSANTRGRSRPEEECPLRTPFQRDRDRIIHCNAYRRLMHKTQVFLSPQGDHYRTRLTHTQEVSQIARTISRALCLNEDLTEAIALGHDLGHTPFGHSGEAVLDTLLPGGFSHSRQSLRVVERLERGGQGLNLTWEVCDGILHHSRGDGRAATLEGRVVHFADKIAYMNHDIEDAVRAGILTEEQLPEDIRQTLGITKGQRITRLISSIVAASGDEIAMEPDVHQAYQALLAYLFATVYVDPRAKGEEHKAKELIARLYQHYCAHPEALPEEYRRILQEEGLERAICDYISGMSDRFCVNIFNKLFIPQSWNG